jgi:hypothetical protein
MARAVAQREARLQQFALLVRSSATRLQQGRPGGRRYRTQDVVRDTPLPEFRLDLSLLAAALRPNRWAAGGSGGGGAARVASGLPLIARSTCPCWKAQSNADKLCPLPCRPLRPQRQAIKKIQTAVPRETELVVAVQRASNLPSRLDGLAPPQGFVAAVAAAGAPAAMQPRSSIAQR